MLVNLQSVVWRAKYALTILELSWCQLFGRKKKSLKCSVVNPAVKCTKMKSARAKRAKLVFFIVKYANF